VQHVQIQNVARQGRRGLQKIILRLIWAGARDIGLWDEIEQPLRSAIDWANLLCRAACAVCVGDCGKWRVRRAEWNEQRWPTGIREAE